MQRVKVISLAALLIFWVGLLAFRYVTEPEPARMSLKYVSGQKASPKAAVITAPMPSIKRWPLIHKPELPAKTPRNIFARLPGSLDRGQGRLGTIRAVPAKARPKPAPPPPAPAVYVPPPPPPPPTPEELAAQRERERVEQERQSRERAIQQARQQMTQYRFLGYLSQNGEPQAFLGKGTDLYILKVGEIVEGQIQVGRIEPLSLTLHAPTLAVESTIQLAK